MITETPAADAGTADGGGASSVSVNSPSTGSGSPSASTSLDASSTYESKNDSSNVERSTLFGDSTAAASTYASNSSPDGGGPPIEGDGGFGALSSLTVGGALLPAFDVNTFEYELVLPGFIHQLSLTAHAEHAATVTVNGQPVDEQGRWASGALDTSPDTFTVEVRQAGRVAQRYRLTTRPRELTQTYLGNPDPERESYGRHSVLNEHGDVLVIGGAHAPPDKQAGVHVYRRSGETWTEGAYIEHPPPAFGDVREWYLALSNDGNTLVTGVPNIRESVPGGGGVHAFQGGAYVFQRKDDKWAWQADLALADGTDEDRFGLGVAIAGDGDLLAVTAPHWLPDRDSRVYLYKRQGESWAPASTPSLPIAPAAFEDGCDYWSLTGVGLNSTGDVLVTAVVGDVVDPCDTQVRVFTRDTASEGEDASWHVTELPPIADGPFGTAPTVDLSADGRQFLVAANGAGGYYEYNGNEWVVNTFGPLDAALSDSGYYMVTAYGIYLRVPSGWELQWTFPTAMGLPENIENGVAISGDGSTATFGPVVVR